MPGPAATGGASVRDELDSLVGAAVTAGVLVLRGVAADSPPPLLLSDTSTAATQKAVTMRTAMTQ
jgi:hypothetical protein